MTTVREHIAGDHKKESTHWGAMAKAFGRMTQHHQMLHKEAGMASDEESPHSKLAAECSKLSESCQAHADYHVGAAEECDKAAATVDLNKNRLIPDNISAIPTNFPIRPVIRAGQREMSANEQPKVDAEFVHLFKLAGSDPDE